MKTPSFTAAVPLLLLLAGCAAGNTAPPTESEGSAATSVSEDIPGSGGGFDLTRISDASRVSALTEKYGCINVCYEMDYGELYTQNITFFTGDDGQLCFIGVFGGDSEFYDGKADYWQESAEGGTESYAYIALGGAEISMDLDGYIFSYGSGDTLKADNYTVTNDGGYIIEASETITPADDDTDSSGGQPHSFRYEYMLAATKDCELVQMKCSCTDTSTGSVDSTLDMKVDYGVRAPDIPAFMDETFEITVITVGADGSENTETAEIPVGFMPYFVMPQGSEYIYSYDREGTQIIDDTFAIFSPCTVYALLQE